MSEIKRYGVWDKPPREDLVTYADHEAAIALRTRVCAEAFEDELARTEERVLADAKARIGRLAAPNGSYGEAEWGFLRGVTAALAALTQPQTEKCPQCGGDGKGPLTHHFGEPCPTCDGGGAATAAGARGADLENATSGISFVALDGVKVAVSGRSLILRSPDDQMGIAARIDRSQARMLAMTIYPGFGATGPSVGEAGAIDRDNELSIRAMAFKGYIDLTEEEEMVLDDAVDAYQTALSWEEPSPYAEAFRERVCPVPEFPGIKAGSVDRYPDHVAPVPQTEGEDK